MMKGMNNKISVRIFILVIIGTFFYSCVNTVGKKRLQEEHKFTNDLINESSPYLIQHAHNPVNWQPWGEAAFEKAKKEGKLVLISIGYSSCHWCHVMERESFENEAVAKIMNDNFVCIKVDREERPDVDQVYMTAVQLMTGRGGWPLNCFTLPDGKPVYGGTYFSKNDWVKILEDLTNTYKKDKQRMVDYATDLTNGIQQDELIKVAAKDQDINLMDLEKGVQNWKSNFDFSNGGESHAPKFPLPNNWSYLMQYATYKEDTMILNHIDLTLTKMAKGGIYDQIGGGFSRYSTDLMWKTPHFEKMLYDNAQLVSLYSYAYQRTKKPIYKQIVYQTLKWVNKEMTTKDGAFYSALDADSEGEEGLYYVWTKSELKTTLTEKEYETLKNYYEINVNGLWDGKYILLRKDKSEYSSEITEINNKLLTKRSERVRPGLDDKSLTSWNALMLEAYCDAYAVFNEEAFLKSALINANWLIKNQLKKEGKLYHTYKNGVTKIDGFLDDYAFVSSAFLKLYEVTFDESWLTKSKKILDYAVSNFKNEVSGMFYYTSKSNAGLITRKMDLVDNVIPSSNSQLARVLYRLGIILNDEEYKKQSKQMLLNVYGNLSKYPSSYSNWSILALNMSIPFYEVAITGDNWIVKLAELNKFYIPNKIVLGGSKSNLEMLEGKFLGETTFFVCKQGACQMPTINVSIAKQQLMSK